MPDVSDEALGTAAKELTAANNPKVRGNARCAICLYQRGTNESEEWNLLFIFDGFGNRY